jgi:hypothetical protein
MEQTKVLIGNVGKEQCTKVGKGGGCIDRVRTVVRDGPLGCPTILDLHWEQVMQKLSPSWPPGNQLLVFMAQSVHSRFECFGTKIRSDHRAGMTR